MLENGTSDFAEFVAANTVETIPGSRAIIIVEVHQVGTSCGYSVPYFDFNKFRPTLNDHFRKKEEKYQAGDPTEHIERYAMFCSGERKVRSGANTRQILGA